MSPPKDSRERSGTVGKVSRLAWIEVAPRTGKAERGNEAFGWAKKDKEPFKGIFL